MILQQETCGARLDTIILIKSFNDNNIILKDLYLKFSKRNCSFSNGSIIFKFTQIWILFSKALYKSIFAAFIFFKDAITTNTNSKE
ncbi:hypothetical protein BpHYR1_039082 [Brachionus plicatilis]|uniref:Uncharacterized protein n=1 Tax=Brachionus plicatilis TaxID=10195 RepID=A0A3M7RZC3_BRAPC|nr:hypothetical protein BpHYR1_039082 [Brachionus plicatilis]